MPDDRTKMPSDKSALERIAPIVAALAAVFSVLTKWTQNRSLPIILVVVALLLAASAYLGPMLRFFRAARRQARRNRYVRAQFPEFVSFVKRFTQFINSGDVKNIRIVLFNNCGHNQSELDKLSSADYLRYIFPHFIRRLEQSHPRDEIEFCRTVNEFYSLAASYNNDYVLEPLRRMKSRLWLQPLPTKQLVEEPKFVPWLASLPEQNRTDAEKQIEDFRERWVSYLDDLMLFLEKLKDSLGAGLIDSYFERPSKL